VWLFFIFRSSKIHVSPTDVVSSRSLPGVASPLINVAMPPHRATLPFHGVKMSSLPPLYLSAILHPVTSHLEPKPKHYIHTITANHPPWTTRLPSSTYIKMSSQSWPLSPPLNRISIFSSSLARASCHQSSTRCLRSLSPSFHIHHPSA
jgi:hypothetical protein